MVKGCRSGTRSSCGSGHAFGDDYPLIRAAIAGQGLALVRDIYSEEEIASGRLALALDRPWPTGFAYYALISPDTAKKPLVLNFISRLKDEIRFDALSGEDTKAC